jgi:hypothetical protein
MRAEKTEKRKDSAQIRAFHKAARQLDADESDERFKDALRKIAKAKPDRPKAKRRKLG